MWFTASSVQGPWVVATSIPAAIYSIPPSSPLYYVTYVKIYDVTPQYVVVGYTPGVYGHGCHHRGYGRVWNGLHLRALCRDDGLVCAARYLRLCGKSNLDALDGLGVRLWLRMGNGRGVGFEPLLGVRSSAVLGRNAVRALQRLPLRRLRLRSVWRRCGLGTRRVGSNHR